MRVLVTGGAGFIGSHLVERLAEEGHEVVVLDNLSTGRRANLGAVADRARLVVADVRDAAAVSSCAAGCGLAFHLAAAVSVPWSVEHPADSHEINLRGTLNVLLAARDAGVRRVVFASSAAVYGPGAPLPAPEEAPFAPVSPYGVEKAAGELYLAMFHRLYGLETTALRFFNVYGPRQDPASPYSGVVSTFADRVRQGSALTIQGDGEQTRDFVYVGDVVRAMTIAATAPQAAGRVYNVGTGRAVRLLDMLAVLERLAGRPIARGFGPPRPGDVRASLADPGRARRELGFAAEVGLEAGLRSVLESPPTAS